MHLSAASHRARSLMGPFCIHAQCVFLAQFLLFVMFPTCTSHQPQSIAFNHRRMPTVEHHFTSEEHQNVACQSLILDDSTRSINTQSTMAKDCRMVEKRLDEAVLGRKSQYFTS